MSFLTPRQRRIEINRSLKLLQRHSAPRLVMFFLVALTGAAGFFASFILLQCGLTTMWVRYLAALSVAYFVFLFLLWLWLRSQADDYIDAPDLINGLDLISTKSQHGATSITGKGGDFSGGGASSSFDDVDALDGVGETLGSVAEAEELAIPLIVIIVFVAILFSSMYIVYSAPILFAELLVDGALSASLYRRLKGLDQRHWLESAIRRTALPFIITAIVIAVIGWGMASYAPQAHSIGDVIQVFKGRP